MKANIVYLKNNFVYEDKIFFLKMFELDNQITQLKKKGCIIKYVDIIDAISNVDYK